MSYIKDNKIAWEEAFEKRRKGWGENHWKVLSEQSLPFFNNDVKAELKEMDLEGKTIAQFCCNNGRELLSAMQLKPAYGFGFDIADNFIAQARQIAIKLNQTNCEFVSCDILDIDKSYNNKFDLIFFTIGAITWLKDLNLLFTKVKECLKENGKVLINDFHPFMNMLAMVGEDDYDSDNLNKITYSYFKKVPWIENKGIGYITPEYDSKPFTSFSHTLSDILNALINSGIMIRKFNEYDYDVGMSDDYEGTGFPLSFILVGEKK